MRNLKWCNGLILAIVVGSAGTGTFAMVLSLGAPTAAAPVFAVGFWGTLLVGALIPKVRQSVLAEPFQPTSNQTKQVVPQRPLYQHKIGKTHGLGRNDKRQKIFEYSRTNTQKRKLNGVKYK